MKLFKFFKKIDWFLIIPAILLTSFGLLSIYGSSQKTGDFSNFKKQIIFFTIAIIFFLVLHLFDLRPLKTNSFFILSLYFLSIFSFLGLLLFGKQIRGVRRWYKIGNFSFAPIAFAAIILIIILSKFFSTRHIELSKLRTIFLSSVYLVVPAILVLLQPDLGSVMILASVWLSIVIFSGMKLRHFFILILIFLALASFGWKFWLRDYQKQRISTFLNSEIDKQGNSWNINQSRIAIGSGGFLGEGIGKGSQTQYGFLPEKQTDFIFSALSEETGFVGVFLLLSILIFLFLKMIKIAFSANDNFTRLFAAGLSFLILIQSFINIGMCLGILPVVGIPLPFVSYGGSNLLAFYFGLGILSNLKLYS